MPEGADPDQAALPEGDSERPLLAFATKLFVAFFAGLAIALQSGWR